MSDYSHSNPSELLSQARQSGDLNALLDLYRSYVKLLARIQIGSRLGGKFDASDIAQEVFFQASRAFPSFRGTSEAEFLSWLRQILATVLANQVRKYHRKQRDIRLERDLNRHIGDASSLMGTVLVDQSPSPSERLAEKELAVMLADALEELTAEYREVVVLRHVEQLSFPEISKRMGRSVSSVKSMWPRALARLRQQLGEAI